MNSDMLPLAGELWKDVLREEPVTPPSDGEKQEIYARIDAFAARLQLWRGSDGLIPRPTVAEARELTRDFADCSLRVHLAQLSEEL